MGTHSQRLPGWIRWALTPLALFVLALLVRALPRRFVLVGASVFPFGNDAWYHLRRIAYSVVHFPEVLRFDPYMNHPAGAMPIWSPLFDWLAAAVALPFYRVGDPTSVEGVVVWLPPVIGAITVVMLYGLALRHLDASIAALSAATLALLSGHFWYSQIGFVDHHAPVAMASTGLLWASMSWLAAEERSGPWLGPVVATGFWMVTALLIWPGSLLFVGLVEAAWIVFALTRSEASRARRFAGRFAMIHGLAAVVMAIFAESWIQWSAYSPVVLSRFQPCFLGLTSLGATLCWAAWHFEPLGATRGRRSWVAAGTALALLGAIGLLIPDLLDGVLEAWQWLAKQEAFQASVGESQPLLLVAGQLDISIAMKRLSGFVLLFPFAWWAAWHWARRRPRPAPLLLWLAWSLGLLAVMLLQRRFFNSFSVCIALLMGWSMVTAWRWLPERWRQSGARGALAASAFSLLFLLFLWPMRGSYLHHLRYELGQDAADRVRPWRVAEQAKLEMARWLQRKTPATSGWLDSKARPEYAVLAPWDLGHVIEYLGRRPTVVNNFGDDIGAENFELARRYWELGEAAGSLLLEKVGARYVVARWRDVVVLDPLPGSLLYALVLRDGSEDPVAPGTYPALSRHRLVFESRRWQGADVDAPAFYKVFEHVRGARVQGRAAAGARVVATLKLQTNHGRKFQYRTRTTADASGHYELRLPYSNFGEPAAVRTDENYTIYCRFDIASLVVDEDAVRSGRRLDGPTVCLTPDS